MGSAAPGGGASIPSGHHCMEAHSTPRPTPASSWRRRPAAAAAAATAIFSNTAVIAGGDDPRPAGRGRDLPDRRGVPGDHRQRLRTARTARASSTTSRRSPSAPCWPRRSRSLIAVPLAVAVALFITHIAPQRLALTARLPRRPAGGDPEHRLRPLGDLRPRPGGGAGDEVAGREPRLHPVLRGPRLGHRPDDAGRRPGARGDDPADRLRGRPRGLLADAAQAPGRRPGARRDPLGDDPDDGPARSANRR